jgi:hypothetical protein
MQDPENAVEGAERVILMGLVSEPASPEELGALERDVRLARILLRGGLVSPDDLEAAARLRQESGLLLEHCLVRLGALTFDAMLEAMAQRREAEPDSSDRIEGGGNAKTEAALHPGR